MTDRLNLEFKVAEVSEAGEFEGFASIFNEVDGYGDVVAPGAFAKSLAAHKRAGRQPLMLWAHRPDEPIGRWTSLRETAQGLLVRGKLLLDVAGAREVYAMLKEEVISGLSIGFRTVQSMKKQRGRLLTEIDLVECSLVALPALSSARVTVVKSQPRSDAAHPIDGHDHVARTFSAGRRAGPIPVSSRSVAARAARDRRETRR